jgi:hypothetical protein
MIWYLARQLEKRRLLSYSSAETSHAARDAQGIHFFPGRCSCLGVFPGLFVEDGRVICLSGPFRSPCIPLGISVENGVLEIVGLESGSGLVMGDFSDRTCSAPSWGLVGVRGILPRRSSGSILFATRELQHPPGLLSRRR